MADWIERGHLRSSVNAEGRRRVSRSALGTFMASQGYRMPALLARERPLLFVIDDEAVWRTSLEAALGDDCDVLCFAHGAEVLLALGARVPDAVVLDMRMPGFDGAQLLRARRRESVLATTFFIVLTAYDDERLVALKLGADAALPKSRAEELRAQIAGLLAGRPGHPPGATATGRWGNTR